MHILKYRARQRNGRENLLGSFWWLPLWVYFMLRNRVRSHRKSARESFPRRKTMNYRRTFVQRQRRRKSSYQPRSRNVCANRHQGASPVQLMISRLVFITTSEGGLHRFRDLVEAWTQKGHSNTNMALRLRWPQRTIMGARSSSPSAMATRLGPWSRVFYYEVDGKGTAGVGQIIGISSCGHLC